MQVGLLLGGDRPVNGGENAAQRGQVDVVVHAYAEDVLPLCVPELDIGHGHGVGAGLNLSLIHILTEAAAFGHDLGHTPFGHAGERVLDEIMPEGFQHNVQSLRVVDRLEQDGDGLNLTYEVRRGILCLSLIHI